MSIYNPLDLVKSVTVSTKFFILRSSRLLAKNIPTIDIIARTKNKFMLDNTKFFTQVRNRLTLHSKPN